MFRFQLHARIILPAVLAALSLEPSWGVADTDKGGREAAVTLATVMGEFGGLHRALRKKVKDPNAVAVSLDLVRGMQGLAAKSLMLTPSMTSTLRMEEKASFLLGYKRQMVKLIGGLLDLEDALLQNDTGRAHECYRRLSKVKSDGHNKFQLRDN